MCVDRSDGSFSWSPIKVSRRLAMNNTSGASDLDINEFDYQPREGVPGFEIETMEDLCFGPQLHIGSESF